MTIRLIKREHQTPRDEKPEKESPKKQAIRTAQEWVEEFKARKAKPNLSLLEALKRA
jgi:hypothetical protein